MNKTYDLDQFYLDKFGWLPDDLHHGAGHFGIFRIPDHSGGEVPEVPYQRRDFYKVSLVRGEGAQIHYADRSVRVERTALVFSDPFIPYSWDHLERVQGGFFCVFDRAFFQGFGSIERYSVFRPDGLHVFELDEAQEAEVERIFLRMLQEKASHYEHRDDMLRTLTFELLHLAMKLQPSLRDEPVGSSANQRLYHLFAELLERQFPIDRAHPGVRLRSPSEYAKQLNIHVNSLNRAVREQTGKTTTELISDRLLQEAKALLRQTDWTVSEVAYALGFSEATHFNAFFRRLSGMTPTAFRKESK